MILETLDVKKNDIFIYSLNRFDLAANFKLINKDTQVKYPKAIHYNDVCRYVQDGRPKNLIVYRLLTNIPTLDVNYLKYGLPINVDRNKEVLYFDPIYALRELEELKDIEQYPNLRFRIQQVGLISMLNSFGQPFFNEVYAFDLQVEEVRAQNDKVFAEIIFVFDEIHFDEEVTGFEPSPNRSIKTRRFETMTAEQLRQSIVEEDPSPPPAAMRKVKAIPTATAEQLVRQVHEEQEQIRAAENLPLPAMEPPRPEPETAVEVPLPGPAPEPQEQQSLNAGLRQSKEKPSFSDFLTKVKRNVKEEEEKSRPQQPGMTNIFRTNAHITDFVNERGKKQVVLKLRKQ